MDHRSFELKFEINAIVYDKEVAVQLADIFDEDLKDAERIDVDDWQNRSRHKQLFEKMVKLYHRCYNLN